ncbi:MAG TPA: FAD-dependent oxidoreductase, partial [Candidatus Eisenbacteria bacterium]|nr:FAD-dependent oxidoreductase [Candidatus Eisenbacteria bacterium]
MESADYVVIGAGFGGAAVAYHLARRDAGDILLLEREPIPGYHASGRNAAMIRQCVPDPAVLALAREGAAFLRQLPGDWPVPVGFKQQGSLLLASAEGWGRLKREVELGRRLGIEVDLWTPEQARRMVPALAGATLDGAAWCPSDGVLDIHALLSGYLRYASDRGARVFY